MTDIPPPNDPNQPSRPQAPPTGQRPASPAEPYAVNTPGPRPGQVPPPRRGTPLPGAPPYGYAYPPPPPPPSKSLLRKVVDKVGVMLFIASLFLNVYLLMFVIAPKLQSSNFRETEYAAGDGKTPNRIVIVSLKGIIDGDQAEFLVEAFHQLEENPPQAVVLRVESGGGGVTASDQIWQAVEHFKEATNVPVVASFGGIAASGGYYVSAGCDYIMAEETCITGSIGVIAQAFTVEGLLEKIGITPEVTVATGSPRKDVANNIMRSWNTEDRDKLRMLLDHMYDRFTDVVIAGRGDKLPDDPYAEAFTGDVFMIDQAQDLGLIDGVGYLDDAIAKAQELANLTNAPRVTEIVQPSGLMSIFSASHDAPSMGHLPDPAQLRTYADQLRSTRFMFHCELAP